MSGRDKLMDGWNGLEDVFDFNFDLVRQRGIFVAFLPGSVDDIEYAGDLLLPVCSTFGFDDYFLVVENANIFRVFVLNGFLL